MTLKTVKEPKYLAVEIEAIQLEIEKYQSWLEDCKQPLKSRCIEMIERLSDEKECLLRRSGAIQKAIADGITDAEVLEMIRLFQKGKGWSEINQKMYGYADYQACRKRTERAVQKIDFE